MYTNGMSPLGRVRLGENIPKQDGVFGAFIPVGIASTPVILCFSGSGFLMTEMGTISRGTGG